MAGNPRRDSRAPDGATDGFLRRWSGRKRAASATPAVTAPDTPPPLRDEDMPPLESLDEASDYRGFLSPGVSDHLHRMALRKLFQGAGFQARDGLDDYDRDYRLLQTLPRMLAEVLPQRELRAQPEQKPEPPDTDATAIVQAPDPDPDPGSGASGSDPEERT